MANQFNKFHHKNTKTFIDYGNLLFDKADNNSSQQRFESLQHKASLVITGSIKGFSTEKLYQELELKSLQNRQWFQKQ